MFGYYISSPFLLHQTFRNLHLAPLGNNFSLRLKCCDWVIPDRQDSIYLTQILIHPKLDKYLLLKDSSRRAKNAVNQGLSLINLQVYGSFLSWNNFSIDQLCNVTNIRIFNFSLRLKFWVRERQTRQTTHIITPTPTHLLTKLSNYIDVVFINN